MNPAQLLAHFDHISDAPHAIPRLRRFILDLAVRGKLVEQDLRDEPASELLKRIQAKKARLVSAGEMKKEKPLPVIEENEIPFAIPANWRWVRLNDVTSYLQRGKSPKYATGEGLPVISQKCIQWRGLDFDSAKLITRESIEEYESIRFLRSGDLLWNSTGTGTIGRIIKVKKPPLKLVCDSHVTVVRCLEVDPEYVRSWIRSDHVYAVIEDRAAGSTNQVELTLQLAMNQVVPLPPLAEQQRIVAKVDELMALCDRLEAAQTERESQRDRLAAASLQRLNNGADADAFRTHTRFYLNYLPRLTTRSEHIQQLRKTILNLAVRGKFVPQDPNDEPAFELLERVAVQKTKAGNAKTGRDWVGDIAKPVDEAFVIPKSWAWTRIANTVERVTVGYVGPMKDHYVQDGIPFLRSQNVRANRFRKDGLISISPKFHQAISKSELAPGDVVVVRSGNVGTACVIPPSLLKANCSDLVVVKHPIAVHPAYLCFYLNSLASTHIEAGTVGVALTHFNTKSVATMPFPLPPLPEQHRIVARVDELMALCDRLEAQLTTTQTESRRLLKAVLYEALSA